MPCSDATGRERELLMLLGRSHGDLDPVSLVRHELIQLPLREMTTDQGDDLGHVSALVAGQIRVGLEQRRVQRLQMRQRPDGHDVPAIQANLDQPLLLATQQALDLESLVIADRDVLHSRRDRPLEADAANAACGSATDGNRGKRDGHYASLHVGICGFVASWTTVAIVSQKIKTVNQID